MSYVSPFTGDVIQPTDVSFRAVTLSADVQLQWPTSSTTITDVTARIMQVTATTTSLSMWLPPANQASVGNDTLIRNVGANSFTVKDYGGVSPIVTIAAGEAKYVYLTANPTTQGTWGVIAYGVGSSSVDSAALAGYGLLAITTTLNQSHPVTSFNTNYTAIASDRAQMYAWTGGAGTLTLTLAATLGNNWFMLLRNAGTGTLTVAATAPNTIDASLSIVLQPNDSCIIVCTGSTYFTVGLGKATQFAFTQLTKAVTSGTYTLSAAEASNVIQKYTGILTGNVTIVVPQTIQVYYVVNATTGVYTVTITTGTGGTTAVLTTATQATLVCDSVNLFNANTILAGSSVISLQDGTVTIPSLTFAAESTTGVYRASAGQFNTTILGVLRSTLSATGLEIAGTGNFTSGVSGGSF